MVGDIKMIGFRIKTMKSLMFNIIAMEETNGGFERKFKTFSRREKNKTCTPKRS